jgi:hypothetical protein
MCNNIHVLAMFSAEMLEGMRDDFRICFYVIIRHVIEKAEKYPPNGL